MKTHPPPQGSPVRCPQDVEAPFPPPTLPPFQHSILPFFQHSTPPVPFPRPPSTHPPSRNAGPSVKTQPPPQGSPARCPQDVEAGDFFRISAGFIAKTTGGFSDDAALRTTRAGLVSASGRPRSGSAEKTPVVFAPLKSGRNPLFIPPLHPPHPPFLLPRFLHSILPYPPPTTLPTFHSSIIPFPPDSPPIPLPS